MTFLLVAIAILLLLSLGLNAFLSGEYLKKFGFMRDFVNHSKQVVTWEYRGIGTESNQVKSKGMRNIVLRSEDGSRFMALVGFKLKIHIPIIGWSYTGFDYYGRVFSDSNGVATISTWLGSGDCDFQFIVTASRFSDVTVDGSMITVTSTDEDQNLVASPTATFPPHFYQEYLGFYA